MRVNNTYVKSDMMARPKAAGKSRSSFGELMSSCSSKVRSMDILTVNNRESVDAESRASCSVPESAGPDILPTDSVETKLSKLREIAENADYTGMTGKEVFSAIWNRYNNAFGGNLAAINIAGFGDAPKISQQYQHEYMRATNKLIKTEIEEKFGLKPGDKGYDDCKKAYIYDMRSAVFGYEEMSYEEREAAIIKKYRGKNTVLDFYNMQEELLMTGVIENKVSNDGILTYIGAVHDCINQIYFPKAYYSGGFVSSEEYFSILDEKLNPVLFFNTMKDHVGHCTFSGFNFDIKEVLFNCIDGFLNALER